MSELIGAWIGFVLSMFLLAVTGAILDEDRRRFWSRVSLATLATGGVAAVAIGIAWLVRAALPEPKEKPAELPKAEVVRNAK